MYSKAVVPSSRSFASHDKNDQSKSQTWSFHRTRANYLAMWYLHRPKRVRIGHQYQVTGTSTVTATRYRYQVPGTVGLLTPSLLPLLGVRAQKLGVRTGSNVLPIKTQNVCVYRYDDRYSIHPKSNTTPRKPPVGTILIPSPSSFHEEDVGPTIGRGHIMDLNDVF
jgi:hypothetical protein